MIDTVNFVDKQVGWRARGLRLQARVSTAEAALLIGVSAADFARLEAGEKRFKAQQLIALSRRFGVAGSAFLDVVDQPSVVKISRPDRPPLH